jgi:predicted TIM-barrel fold metal-dependent hydrolase
MLEFIFDSARAASDLLFNGVFERYPHIDWIFPHCGGVLPLLAQRMELFRAVAVPAEARGNGQGATVPEQLGRLWCDMAGTPFPHQVPALTAAFGIQRVLYGSDSCWTPAPGVDAQLASLDAAAAPSAGPEWRALAARNARRLFPRLTARPHG